MPFKRRARGRGWGSSGGGGGGGRGRLAPVSNVLREIAHELHKPARYHFARRNVKVRDFKDLWQADLMIMKDYKYHNKGYKYGLLVIDCFSKYIWIRPLKTKRGEECAAAFRSILESEEKAFLKPPKLLQIDKGTEFYNKEFVKVCEMYNIHKYSTASEIKAGIAERAIRTIKTLLYREMAARASLAWTTFLDDIVKQYNRSKHRTTNLAPNSVTKKDKEYLRKVHDNIHASRPPGRTKFHVGDRVRISKARKTFHKGYTPNWTTEIFNVTEIQKTNPITYRLRDQKQELLKGGFYNEELQKTTHPKTYLVEKVIRKEGNQSYVKWYGFPDSENSWVTNKAFV